MAKAKEARRGTQEEFETQHGKGQACAQVGGKARNAEKSEVQGPARRHEREEEAAAGHGGKKTSDGDASRNQGYRRHRGADQPHRGPGHLTSCTTFRRGREHPRQIVTAVRRNERCALP